MSNPTFVSGPITFDVAEDVKKYRLVELTATGIKHAAAAGPVYGAVAVNGFHDATGAIGVDYVKAARVAVHKSPASLPLELDAGVADVQPGTTLYAAADGKVSTTGTVVVGVAIRPSAHGRVITTLALPAVAPATGA